MLNLVSNTHCTHTKPSAMLGIHSHDSSFTEIKQNNIEISTLLDSFRNVQKAHK